MSEQPPRGLEALEMGLKVDHLPSLSNLESFGACLGLSEAFYALSKVATFHSFSKASNLRVSLAHTSN